MEDYEFAPKFKVMVPSKEESSFFGEPPCVWGHHLVCDLSSCDKEKVADIENIKTFCAELLPAIDMLALGEPKYENLVTDEAIEKGIDGYSFVQFIQTSAITMHFVNSTGRVYCDLFSCKDFNDVVVRNLLLKWFGGKVKYMNKFKRY